MAIPPGPKPEQEGRRDDIDTRPAARRNRSPQYNVTVSAGLIALDVVALSIGWLTGSIVSASGTPITAASTGVAMTAVAISVTIASFAALGLYRSPVKGIGPGGMTRLLQSMGAAAMAVVVWQAVLSDVVPDLVLASVVSALVCTSITRFGFDIWLVGRRARGDFHTPVVVAGTAEGASALVEFLRVNPEAGFRATATVGEIPLRTVPTHLAGHTESDTEAVPWMGGIDRARTAVDETGASGVLLALGGLPSDAVNEVVLSLSVAGIPVYLSSGLTGVSLARMHALSVAHEPISLVRPARHSATQRFAKRAVDVAVASLVLIVTAPVIVVAAVFIKRHDGGPVLFRQVRIGKDGKPFTLVKLRTMEVDAEARLTELQHRNERHGPLFKVSGDPRITPVGALLRSAAIDELPQLVNVLMGRMSMVGPRPALPAETAEFDAELQRRHLVRPGVTGLWQVEANHKASFDEYRRLDLFYVDNWSVALDLAVMIGTVPALCRRGLGALRPPASSAPAPVGSSGPLPKPVEVGP